MSLVNDITEHGVALMDAYNELITNNEEHKQYLLVAKHFRQKHLDRAKSTLIQ